MRVALQINKRLKTYDLRKLSRKCQNGNINQDPVFLQNQKCVNISQKLDTELAISAKIACNSHIQANSHLRTRNL